MNTDKGADVTKAIGLTGEISFYNDIMKLFCYEIDRLVEELRFCSRNRSSQFASN